MLTKFNHIEYSLFLFSDGVEKTILQRCGLLHDIGSGFSHKWIICNNYNIEGESIDQIVHERYHSLRSVGRYQG
ncbi:MAG: DUF1670 domain-containing protein [Planctomycetota bacterium]